jgi:hypothetical protein
LKLNWPVALLVVCVTWLVAKSVKETAAPGTALPDASNTLPSILPWERADLRGGTIPRALAQNKLHRTIPHTINNLRTL